MRYRPNGFGQFFMAVLLVLSIVLSFCALNGCGSHSAAPTVHKTNFAWGENHQCDPGTHLECTTDTDGNVSCSCVPD